MKNGKKKNTKNRKTILTVLIVLTLAVIWGHSMMPGDVSGEESGFVYRILKPVLDVFLPDAWVTEHLVRKIAHYSEYAVLGTEMFLYTLWFGEESRRPANAFFCGLSVAFLDETIQIFSGRGSAVADMWIDLAGFTTALLIGSIVVKLRGKKAAKKRIAKA